MMGFHFCERGRESRTEHGYRNFYNGLCADCTTTLTVDQHIPGNYGLARRHFGARSRSLDRPLSIGSQPGCFRSVCVDRQTVWPGSYAADETALVRLRDEGRHGRTTGRCGRYSKFSNWSNGKRRACCVPGYLHEYYADLASPRRRSCHGRSASECLAGFGAALLTLHLAAVPLGSALALIAALSVSVAWNAGLYIARHRKSLA